MVWKKRAMHDTYTGNEKQVSCVNLLNQDLGGLKRFFGRRSVLIAEDRSIVMNSFLANPYNLPKSWFRCLSHPPKTKHTCRSLKPCHLPVHNANHHHAAITAYKTILSFPVYRSSKEQYYSVLIR